MSDKAGSMPHVDVALTGKAYTDADKRMVQSAVFYLQEVIKIFPKGANISLVATWEHDGNQRETVNLGTLSNMDIISLLCDVEKIRQMQNMETKGNG